MTASTFDQIMNRKGIVTTILDTIKGWFAEPAGVPLSVVQQRRKADEREYTWYKEYLARVQEERARVKPIVAPPTEPEPFKFHAAYAEAVDVPDYAEAVAAAAKAFEDA